MAGDAVRGLARLLLTGLMIASLAVSATNLSALAKAPVGAAFVARGTAGIAAATEHALAVHATPAAVAARLDALLAEAPRNWLAIDAVTALAAERGIALPADLLNRRAEAWDEDSGLRTVAVACLQCIRDAATCDMTLVLMCRAPIELSAVGDLTGVVRGGLDYVAGREVDEVEVILSVIGLTALALAASSGGGSLTVKAGASFAKLAKSMKRLPDAITRPLIRSFREGVAWDGISQVRRLDDLVGLLRVDVMRPAARIAEDAGQMIGKTSVRDGLHLMKYVDDPADLSRMARASDALGPRMVGTIEVLGKSRVMRLTMRMADEVWLIFSGLIGALAAALALLQSLIFSALSRRLRGSGRKPGHLRGA